MADPSVVPPVKSKVKELLWKSAVSVTSLTTAAAIPILVQRFLPPPPPVTPATTVPMASPQVQPQEPPATVASPHDAAPDRDRKQRHRDKDKDDDDD
jgi:hypothetical protein